MPIVLRRGFFLFLLLAISLSIVSCDSSGSNGESQDEEPKLEDLIGQSRLITSEDSLGNVFDARESSYDYYYSQDPDGVDFHVCRSDDSIEKGRLRTVSTRVNSSGNLVKTEEVVEAVAGFDPEDEGTTYEVEYLEIGSDVGETGRWEIRGLATVRETARRIEEIPKTDQDCANREDFHN